MSNGKNTGFWSNLPNPIIGLSPMDGVTDHPFRYIQKKYGKPDLIITEFTSVEGVCHGASQLLKDFQFDETQRPIVAQIYGTTPDFFRQTAIVLCELGFDGIDVNMGCPAKNVAHSGAGAALIRTPDLAQKIIQGVQQGINEWQNGATLDNCPDIVNKIKTHVETRNQELPVQYKDRSRIIPISVKTRIGYSEPVISEWIPTLLETGVANITLHGRTLKQQYSGQANWEVIGQAAEICKKHDTLILGNGDVTSRQDALDKIKTYDVDGVLIGRASMGDPFIFSNKSENNSIYKVAVEHSKLFEKNYSHEENYSFMPMRKHLGWYVKSVPFAGEIRVKLFQSNTAQEVETILENYQLL